MRVPLLVLFLLFTALLKLFAQQDMIISGIVVEQNSKYRSKKDRTYLSGVEITIGKGYSTLSLTDGTFSLKISDVQPGAGIQLTAKKTGFEVVNTQELRQSAVAGRLTPIKVVMCPAGQLTQNIIFYNKIAVEAAEEQYQRKLAILKTDNDARRQLIKELENSFNIKLNTLKDAERQLAVQRDAARYQAEALARQFAQTNLDDADSLFVLAYEAFLKKRIDKVLEILSIERLTKNVQDAESVRDTAIRMIKDGQDLQKRMMAWLIRMDTLCRCALEAQLNQQDTIAALQVLGTCMRNGTVQPEVVYYYTALTCAYLKKMPDDPEKLITLYEIALVFCRETNSESDEAFDRQLVLIDMKNLIEAFDTHNEVPPEQLAILTDCMNK